MKKILLLLSLLVSFGASAQIFYKVEGKDLKSPSYLFGTHHLAPIAILDSIDGVSDALSGSVAVVGEIDMAAMQANSMALTPFMMAPADSTLTKLYSPEEFERLNGEFKKWSGGLDLRMFDAMKPLVPNMTIALNMVAADLPDFVPGEQLDAYFQSVATMAGKPIVALESIEEQGDFLFNCTTIAEQAKALAELLDNPDKSRGDALRLNECYFNHDIESILKESVEESEDPKMFESLLYRRNANWLNRLPSILSDGSVFVAVGALHLAGPKGLVEGLRQLGYTVTPLDEIRK